MLVGQMRRRSRGHVGELSGKHFDVRRLDIADMLINVWIAQRLEQALRVIGREGFVQQSETSGQRHGCHVDQDRLEVPNSSTVDRSGFTF